MIGDNLKVIRVVTDKGTASADTMHKLYIEVGASKTDVYYTIRTGTSPNYTYSWKKLDTDILDDLSINWSDIQDKPSTYTPSSHTHGNLQNDGQIGSTVQAGKNVVTDPNGKITTEDKPTIPSASTTLPSADVSGGVIGNSSSYAKADHQHPLSTAYAASVHSHSEKLDVAQTSFKGKNVVVDNTTGEITFEDKYSHPSTKQCNYAYTHPNTKQCDAVIPSASSDTPVADTTNGSAGDGSTWARSNHSHPKSSLYAEASHSHTASDLPATMPPSLHTHGNLQNDGSVGTSNNASKNVVTDGNGKITTEDKPTIPTVVDTVQDGNSNAVSSNAVYDYITTIIGDIDTWLVS